jgi:hypothetical protein
MGTGTGSGAQQMQGVMLATEILGSTVTVNSQGTGTGTGTGTGLETSTPASGTGLETSTPASGTGSGTGTGTGDFSSGTVKDMIVEPMTGNLQYVVVSFGSSTDTWVPIPVSLLSWDSTMNGFVLNTSADVLQTAPSFSSSQFPDTSTSGWDQEWSTFWQSNGSTGSGMGTGTGSGASATATP